MKQSISIIIAVLIFVGCKDAYPKEEVVPLIVINYDSIHKVKSDSVFKSNIDKFDAHNDSFRRNFDSGFYYLNLSNEYKIKALTNEAKYYQTEDEKYRLLANKQDALKAKYGKLAGRFMQKVGIIK